MRTADIVVIGAGLGGLHAAAALHAAGRTPVVLEARGRAGGRIESVPHPLDPGTGLDLGPTWFWPHQRAMRQLLEALELGFFEQPEDGDALYQMPGAPLQRVGGPSPPSFRVVGGMQAMIDALAGRLPPGTVMLDTPVVAIGRVDDEWRLRVGAAGASELRARHLFAALPPRVLLAIDGMSDTVSPALARELAATDTWMAAHAKFVAAYERPFWRDAGFAGTAFSRVGPMVEVHDAGSAGDGAGALFGFLGIPASARSHVGEAALVQACVAQFVELFGDDAAAPVLTRLADWAGERFTATARDLEGQGAHPSMALAGHREELATLGLELPVSEASPAEAGYLEGALIASSLAVESLLGRA